MKRNGVLNGYSANVKKKNNNLSMKKLVELCLFGFFYIGRITI